ncbi:MAG: hypothetical protein NWE98_06390 [Candidatus Bathyarchaeota archaeon]|nr:hypothetical protein [Candidatus Bathyarchaeota archaeon]
MERKTAFAAIIISALMFTMLIQFAAAEPPELQWENTYGYLSGFMAIQTRDQGYAIVGTYADFVATFEPYNNYSATLIKTDSDGKLLWQKTYITNTGGNTQLTLDENGNFVLFGSQNPAVVSSGANAVFQTADGGYVIAGTETWLYNFESSSVSITNGKYTIFFLLKTDSDGNVVWHKTYEPGNGGNNNFTMPVNAALNKVIQTDDGGYLMAGSLNLGEFGWVVKVDASGNKQWQKIYRLGQNDSYAQVYYAEQTSDGYLLAGNFGGNCLLKISSEGEVTYFNRLNDSRSTFTNFFKGHDGTYLWVGFSRIQNQPAGSILSVDANGNVVANKTYPHAGSFNLGVPTTDGGYLLAQTLPLPFMPVFSSFNTTLFKLDAAGNVEWHKMYGQILDQTNVIFPTADGGFGLVGTRLEGYPQWKYDSTTYKQWIFLAKTAPLTAPSTALPTPTVPEAGDNGQNLFILALVIAIVAVTIVAILTVIIVRRKQRMQVKS